MASKAQIIDFLLAGYRNPSDDTPLAGGTVDVTLAGTSTTAYVWDDRDKTLPTGTGRSTVTLDAYGKAEVYGDGIYKFVIKDSGGVEVETIDYVEYQSTNASISSTRVSGAAIDWDAATDTSTSGKIVTWDGIKLPWVVVDWYDLTGGTDYHDAILAAVDAADALGIPVLFPSSSYDTSPVSFEGYNAVHLKGSGLDIPSGQVTTINFLGSSGIGFQFSDTTNPSPTWISSYSMVEGMFLDGGGTPDGSNYYLSGGIETGINYSRGMKIRDVAIRHFSSHGLIQEDNCDVPEGELYGVSSQFNGGDGHYVRGGATTIMRKTKCQFDGNNGWGLNIEGGAGVSHRDVTAQANKTGGLRIYYTTEHDNGTYPINISNQLFEDFYTEVNEGPALLIDSVDSSTSQAKCANQITFINSKINKGSGQLYANINRVYGVTFISTDLENATVGTDLLLGANAFAIEYNGKSFAPVNDLPTASDHFLSFYHRAGAPKGMHVNGGWYPERGRTQVYTFVIDDIAANSTALMDTVLEGSLAGLGKGYLMPFTGSILKLVAFGGAFGGGTSGELTFRPLFGFGSGGNLVTPVNPLSGAPTVTLNRGVGTNVNSSTYAVNAKPFTAEWLVGMEVSAPVGYVAGTNTKLVVNMFVEY